MKKDLPKVFANPINKELKNNNDIYYSYSREERHSSQGNILDKINYIFASPHHVYKSLVLLKTKKGQLKTTIVGKSGNFLLTLNGEKINILDIIDIERI